MLQDRQAKHTIIVEGHDIGGGSQQSTTGTTPVQHILPHGSRHHLTELRTASAMLAATQQTLYACAYAGLAYVRADSDVFVSVLPAIQMPITCCIINIWRRSASCMEQPSAI